MKNTIHFTLNKSRNRKSLTGVSTREAISTDRLNYTESMELQPFTPGLNISKSRKETNSAGSYSYVCTCHHQRSRNSCYTWFQRSRDFPPVKKPINWHVSQDTLPCQLHTFIKVKTNSDWTPQQVTALQQLLIIASIFMTIMVIAASVVASMNPCLDWNSLPYTRCNEKQNITFSYGFTGGRKLKPALFLPQEEGVCYMPPVPYVMATVLSPLQHRIRTLFLLLPQRSFFFRVPSISNR